MSLFPSRRRFLSSNLGLGAAALVDLLGPTEAAAQLPRITPTAKRVIYLFMHGGPSQMDLFDHKPSLQSQRGKELPDSVRQGQRLTGMTSGQKSLPIAPSVFSFSQHGQSGAWISELMPHLGDVADEICFLKAMHTEAINHDPAVTLLQTGHQIPGRPSFGSWLSYGLGIPGSGAVDFFQQIIRVSLFVLRGILCCIYPIHLESTDRHAAVCSMPSRL